MRRVLGPSGFCKRVGAFRIFRLALLFPQLHPAEIDAFLSFSFVFVAAHISSPLLHTEDVPIEGWERDRSLLATVSMRSCAHYDGSVDEYDGVG